MKKSHSKARFLNLGCGTRFCSAPEWLNADHVPPPGGTFVDLRQPLPFPDKRFDLIYLSHVLEHFRPADGRRLVEDCIRVLAPGGCLRLVVPDIENIARHYLNTLDACRSQSADAVAHEWAVLELTDQLSRNFSGGELATFLRRGPHERAMARRRQDIEIDGLCRWFETGEAPEERILPHANDSSKSLRQRLRSGLMRLGQRLIGGESRAHLAVGAFRCGGEVHLQMFDSFSLETLLRDLGLQEVSRCSAFTSHQANWTTYGLDADAEGNVYKPASLFVEGIRR